MNILQYLQQLPALPFSNEKPCTKPSGSELRRWIKDGSVIINGERWTFDEEAPPMVWQLVFFPKGKKKTTMI